MPNQRLYWVAAFILLLAGAGWIFLSAGAPPPQTIAARKGFLAPELSISGENGETLRLSDYRGKAVILNIWASWCPPCKAEMPALEETYRAYASRGLVVLGLNATYQDSLAAAEAFVAQAGLTFPIWLDEDAAAASVFPASALPTTYFIDSQGVIREVVVGGPMAEAFIRSQAERLLAGGR